MRVKSEPVRIPYVLQFRHMRKSRRLRQLVEQQLEHFIPFATEGSRCKVVVDKGHPSRKGGVYSVSVRLDIPGHRLYVAHRSRVGMTRESLLPAVSVAFEEIHRQLMKSRTRRRKKRYLLAA